MDTHKSHPVLHKVWIFTFSTGCWFCPAGYAPAWKNLPTNPELGRLYNTTQTWNRRLNWFSVIIWLYRFFCRIPRFAGAAEIA